MKLRCPVCKNIISEPSQGQEESSRYFPFCSERCKLVDLGAWLDCDYRITTQTKASQTSDPLGQDDEI